MTGERLEEGSDVVRAIGDVSRETIERLTAFRRVLETWQPRTNLVGASTLEAFWSRHAADAAFLHQAAPQERVWLDAGSGAGIPGLLLAAFLARTNEPARLISVEANGRKCAFQRTALAAMNLRETATKVDIRQTRLEAFVPDVQSYAMTARAFAPLSRILDHAVALKPEPRRLLLLKGKQHADEIKNASKLYDMEVRVVPHPTSPGSVLLDIPSFRSRAP